MVKFARASITEWLGTPDNSDDKGKRYSVTLVIKGEVLGITFEGSDTIDVLHDTSIGPRIRTSNLHIANLHIVCPD